MVDYDKMTDDEFDSILYTLVDKYSAHYLMIIPGVYELVKAHYNDAVLNLWELTQERLKRDGETDNQASEEAEGEGSSTPEAQGSPSGP